MKPSKPAKPTKPTKLVGWLHTEVKLAMSLCVDCADDLGCECAVTQDDFEWMLDQLQEVSYPDGHEVAKIGRVDETMCALRPLRALHLWRRSRESTREKSRVPTVTYVRYARIDERVAQRQ